MPVLQLLVSTLLTVENTPVVDTGSTTHNFEHEHYPHQKKRDRERDGQTERHIEQQKSHIVDTVSKGYRVLKK